MDAKRAVCEYIDRADWRVNENANVGYSIQGLNLYLAGKVSARYWLEEVYPKEVADLHESGHIHIHDLQSLSSYCVGWDLADLLFKGFGGVHGRVESNPPKHLSTALLQLVNFLFTLQMETAGAVAVSNWDTLLAPFVREDGLSYREVKQIVQEFVFNLNVPTRVGSQPPFTNITIDILPPPGLADKPAIVGGKPRPYTYGELREEMGMLVRALFEILLEGDAKGRPFTFPIPTIDINHEFPWDDPALEPMWEATAKYGTPYFQNFITTGRSRDEVRSMCCRLSLSVKDLNVRKGGIFASHPLTGSLGVITISLPMLAYEAGDVESFFSSLREAVRIAARGLVRKAEFVEEMTERGLYPYSRYWLQGVKEAHGRYWAQHFLTVGVIGAHEARINLLGEGIETTSGVRFARRILETVLEEIGRLQEETGYLFNLEATPAEGASHRLARVNKRVHPKIYASGEEPGWYYTNSTQLPVDLSWDLYEVIRHQSELQPLYTGGTVLHIWLGERAPNGEAVKNLVRQVFYHFPLPYITITPTFSVCPSHGYLAGEVSECPRCGAHTEVYSRVVGYLRPVGQWNKGKRTEFKQRRYFS